ncbi:hypothetical protein EPO56_02640 [Patescibacteria group bacterium]|nr:MAG: hypothetical protein EPO56_02640 [Patescibacteria group bacterium]
MEDTVVVSWYAVDNGFKEKDRPWFWAVGLVGVGVAVAAFILQNYLFSLIAVLSSFTVMIVGAQKPPRHKYSFTERGFLIGQHLMPYSQMDNFSIHEDEPRKLSIGTKTLTGVVTVPLADVDHRIIRTELKNRNIEEVDKLDSFIAGIARRVGL